MSSLTSEAFPAKLGRVLFGYTSVGAACTLNDLREERDQKDFTSRQSIYLRKQT